MPDPLKDKRRGDPFEPSAAQTNAHNAAARDYLRRLGKRTGDGGGGVSPDPCVIRIKNGTGGNLPRFSILGISGTVISPDATTGNLDAFKELVALVGRVPDLPSDAGRFVVTLADAASNEIVDAVAMGCVQAQVDVDDSGDLFAEAIHGQTVKLMSTGNTTQTAILWKETGTGLRWAVVRLGSTPEWRAQFKYMAEVMKEQNVPGGDYIRAHPAQPVEES